MEKSEKCRKNFLIMHYLLDKSVIEWYNIAVMKENKRVFEADFEKSCKERRCIPSDNGTSR